MELREFADGMKQQEQLEFLEQRFDQLTRLLGQKSVELEQATDDQITKIKEEIEQIELIITETDDYANQFAFNELVFGFPVSNAVVDLYEATVLNPYAEY